MEANQALHAEQEALRAMITATSRKLRRSVSSVVKVGEHEAEGENPEAGND